MGKYIITDNNYENFLHKVRGIIAVEKTNVVDDMARETVFDTIVSQIDDAFRNLSETEGETRQ